MKMDHVSALMAATLFAIGAVAVIIYQHMNATNRVIAAMNTGNGRGISTTVASSGIGAAASLAGMPTVGQTGTSAMPPVMALHINPGYTLQ